MRNLIVENLRVSAEQKLGSERKRTKKVDALMEEALRKMREHFLASSF